MCTPNGSRLYEARTWSGSDWSGRRPLTSLTTWVSCAEGTSSMEKSLPLMGPTGARRGADGGRVEPCHRRHLRQGRDPGDRADAVEEGVVAVGRLEAGERRGRPAGGGRPGQHETDHHRREECQGQPRAPAMSRAALEHQSE